jgi:pyrimidine-nucleoside phosphorylase
MSVTETKTSASPEMLKLIEAKRQGQPHSIDELSWFINHLSEIPDYQITAWLMAVCINGLNEEETINLTKNMAYSGHVLTLKREADHVHDDHEGDKENCHSIHVTQSRGFVDKHSTGGVGDKVTLALAPILASLGFKISKFSGRALGHTGGTIDKLETIPGFKTDLSMKQFEKQIKEIGIALASQSTEFAPADKRLYSLRDRTATVQSIPLIASSVMSKKIAGGADIVLLDVKVGSGAFMKEVKTAKELAKLMVKIGKAVNLNTKAILSNMDQPLGSAVGNGPELVEAISLLEGNCDNDLYELVMELASTIASTIEIDDVIRSGKAYVKFTEWIEAQGGDISKIKEATTAKFFLEYRADQLGYVKELDALKIGQAIHELSYSPKADGSYDIDNAAGLWLKAKIGDEVHPGDILFAVQGNDEAALADTANKIIDAYLFSEHKVKKPKLILKRYS